eukprot:1999225-Pyramimonas_sp.AAC.1
MIDRNGDTALSPNVPDNVGLVCLKGDGAMTAEAWDMSSVCDCWGGPGPRRCPRSAPPIGVPGLLPPAALVPRRPSRGVCCRPGLGKPS